MPKPFKSVCFFLDKSLKKASVFLMIVVLVSILVTALISVLLSEYYNLTLSSVGNIKTIGVESYSDVLNKNKLNSINWGTLSVGSSITQTIFIKSFSNSDIILNINVTDWSPVEISNYLTIFWDYDGNVLHPGQRIELNFVIFASPSIELVRYLVVNEVNNFNCDIYITALEL